MENTQWMSASRLSQGYRDGSISPLDTTQDNLNRLRRYNKTFNAVCIENAEEALNQAEASSRRWAEGEPLSPIDGVPVTIKDVIAYAGLPLRRGSKLSSDAPCTFDAPSSARLREAGAVMLGKTVTAEFGWKAVTDNPLHGVTRNPWDTSLTPGGSSGGSASALAAGIGALSVGTDGGGSVRIPAAFTGTAALKPTFGRIPSYPYSAFECLPNNGPMARSVGDLAMLLDVIGRFDPRDPNALPDPQESFVGRLTESGDRLDGIRIAYSTDFGYAHVENDVASAVAQAVEVLSSLGASVVEIDPPFADPTAHFHTLWFAGAEKIVSTLPQDRLHELDPALLDLVRRNREISAHDYLVAMQARYEMASAMAVFHQSYDVLVSPTVGISPFTAGLEVPETSGFSRWTEWAAFTLPFNMTQQPAASIPCGRASNGLPVGLQIVAARNQDSLALRVAGAFEQAAGGFEAPPGLAGLERSLDAASTANEAGPRVVSRRPIERQSAV